MKHKKNIDDLFKEQLSSFEATPSPEVWKHIEAQLKKEKKLDIIGGEFYLIQLTQKVSSSAHIEFHARIILQKYIQRSLIKISN